MKPQPSQETVDTVYDALQSVMTDPKYDYNTKGIGPSELQRIAGLDVASSTVSHALRVLLAKKFVKLLPKSLPKKKYYVLTNEGLYQKLYPTPPALYPPAQKQIPTKEPTTVAEFDANFVTTLNEALGAVSLIQEACEKLAPFLLDLVKDHDTYTKVKSLLHNMRGQTKI